jgi:hypothetical protein
VSITPTSPKPHHHVVIAGGCHVNGFPIGGAFSFVRVMLQLAPYADPSTIAPINLRNCSTSLLCHLREHPADAVILQLGNYETMGSVKKHIRSILHLNRHGHDSSRSKETNLDPDAVFPSTTAWRLRVLSKQIYAHSFGHIHPPLFDADSFRRHAEQLFSDLEHLQASAPKLVVFLSPIPCADPLIRHYRHEAARILGNLCSNASTHLPFRLRYLDTEQALGLNSRNVLSTGIFADDLHLNRKGHEILGNTLAAIMQHDPCFAVQEDRMHSMQ